MKYLHFILTEILQHNQEKKENICSYSYRSTGKKVLLKFWCGGGGRKECRLLRIGFNESFK